MKLYLFNPMLIAMVLCAILVPFSIASSRANSQGFRFVCRMNALSGEERARLPKVLDKLIQAGPKVHELSNGFELTFKSNESLFQLAAEWLSMEKRCCSFFAMSLSVEEDNGPMTIRITGPEGVKEFINGDLPKLHQLMSGR